MFKKEFIQRVAEECGITKVQAAEEVNDVFAVLRKVLIEGEDVAISNFGAFKIKTSRARDYLINFGERKGEKVHRDESKRIHFTVSPLVTEELNA